MQVTLLLAHPPKAKSTQSFNEILVLKLKCNYRVEENIAHTSATHPMTSLTLKIHETLVDNIVSSAELLMAKIILF